MLIGPKRSRERDVLLGRQPLVAEEDDAMLVERLADVGDRLRVEAVRQVDAQQFRPERAGGRAHFKSRVAHLLIS